MWIKKENKGLIPCMWIKRKQRLNTVHVDKKENKGLLPCMWIKKKTKV